MNKRAIIYGRVSYDDRKNDDINLQSQLEMGREYCQEHGYTVVAELAEDDRGASGADFNLPRLNEALDMARAGQADVLVARELDRFARKLAKQLIVEQEFKRAGVDVEYALEEYEDTPEGQLTKNVRAIIAEFEREKISERMTRARLNRVKAGSVMAHGQPPFGYRIAKVGTKSVFVIDEQEARIVRLIFDWYIQGNKRTEIVAKLNAMNVATWQDKNGIRCKKRPTGCWSVPTISKILSNETYCGVWHYRKTTRVNGKKVRRPREEWLSVEVPAIVSRETWEAVHEIRERNKKRAKRNRKYHYLLVGHIICGHCALSLRGNAQQGRNRLYMYYRCNGHDPKTVRTCDLPRFRVEQVDTAVWQWIREKMSNSLELRKVLENRQAEQERENAPLRERLSVVDELIKENQVKLERALDLYLSGDFPREMLTERKARLETAIAALEKERHGLAVTLEARTLTSEQVQSIDDFAREVEQAFALLDQTDFEAKRAMIERIDVQVRLMIENDEKVAYVSSAMLGKKLLFIKDIPSKKASLPPIQWRPRPVGALAPDRPRH